MSPDWLEDLNPAQREAATHGEGPLLIVAGAGTGKTKTLAARVAYLLHEGAAPSRLLLLTFTRRSAAEMLGRARNMSGHPQADRIWGGTFHAVANRLLRIYGSALGLPPAFTVMDQGDAADLMNLIRSEHNLGGKGKRFPRKETLVNVYSRTVNAQEPLDTVLDRHYPWCVDWAEELRVIFDDYTRRKRESQIVDYDDLLLLWIALCGAEGVGARVCRLFDHILVDEYQDTNRLQCEILRAMHAGCRNVVAVGDDAQSIYSFRAATVRNILDFETDFPGARRVTLEKNYRSTQPILNACNALMEEAPRQFKKELRSDRPGQHRPVLLSCRDETQQADQVCRNVLAHVQSGTALRRQAVLFRTGHHSDLLEVELARRHIPFHKYGGLKFVETGHIKDVLAVFRIMENPNDQVSWFRVLQLLDGIGPKAAQRIVFELGVRGAAPTGGARSAGGALVSPLGRMITHPPTAPSAAVKEFEALRQLLAQCGAPSTNSSPAEDPDDPSTGAATLPLVTQVERVRAFYEPFLERLYENPKQRARDLDQLEIIAAGYRSRRSFLTDLTLDPPSSTTDLADKPFLEEDFLVLSTIHSAKGCEWDVVHVIHAADGMIPSDMALQDEAGLDEERRLLYVAMTRAKDRLYVYFPLRYYHKRTTASDAHNLAKVSRFLSRQVRSQFVEFACEQGRPGGAESGLREVEQRLQRLWSG